MSENKDTLAVLRKQSFFLAMGLILLVDGALACMVKADFFPFTLSQIWPVFVIIAGLIVFGSVHFQKNQNFFPVPFSDACHIGIWLSGFFDGSFPCFIQKNNISILACSSHCFWNFSSCCL